LTIGGRQRFAERVSRLAVRIVGTPLPGRRHGDLQHVHVGVQRGREVVDLVPGDAERAVFELDIDVVRTPQGIDFRGPYVHGKKGERFLYLSWGELAPGGSFEMFRRAKLQLSALDAEQLDHAVAVQGELSLSDACGAPLCASVRPPKIVWKITLAP